MLGRIFPSGERNLAKVVTFQVTDDCCLRCTYCYQTNKGHHRMSFETAKKFADMILDNTKGAQEYIDSPNCPGVILEFIGGEPLMEVELISRITDYFLRKAREMRHPWATRYRISICSNGVLYFDPAWQDYMQRHKNNLSFSVSVDGCKELHDACRVFPDGSGSYDKAMEAVRHYRDVIGGDMGSKMTIAPGNITYTAQAVKSLLENGYREIFMNCVYEEGWTLEHARIFYRELLAVADYIIASGFFGNCYVSVFEETYFRPKRAEDNQNWCGGDGQMIACDWKGDIYPCIRYMESSLGEEQKPLKIGDVDSGIMQRAVERDCVACLRSITRRSQSTDECFSCPIAEGCSWCTAYNYQVFGTPDKRATYICLMHRARALANCYFWNMGYRITEQPKRQRLYVPDAWAEEIVGEEELAFLKRLSEA